jgi:invasion protein IalB
MMTAKRALGLLLALFALVAAPAAMAQDNPGGTAAPPDAPAVESGPAPDAGEAPAADAATPDATATPELPWLKFCGTLADDSGQKLCLVRQLVYAQNQLIARFILRDNPAEDTPLLVLAAMPNGVTLPFGLRLQIDNGREMILPYIQCDAAMCNVRTVVDEAFVNSLKRGAVLKLTAKNARGTNFTVEIDLKGFTSVYDSTEFVSLDDQGGDQTATDKLGQAVQDLAEQIRRQKEEGATPPPADQPATPEQPATNGQ